MVKICSCHNAEKSMKYKRTENNAWTDSYSIYVLSSPLIFNYFINGNGMRRFPVLYQENVGKEKNNERIWDCALDSDKLCHAAFVFYGFWQAFFRLLSHDSYTGLGI